MKRSTGFSKAHASVSVLAISTLLFGCSQPASYATVDLSGSSGGGVQPQYSATTGLPVYQSTQVYTDPFGNGLPQTYVPQSQLAQSYIPGNQVASLDPSIGYNSIVQQSYPAQSYASPAYIDPSYSNPSFSAQSVAPSPMLTPDTVLSSDGFVSVGEYGAVDTSGPQTAFLAPGAGSLGLPLPPAPQVQQPVYQSAPEPQYEPLNDQSYEFTSPVPSAPVIESAPLGAPIDTLELAAPTYSASPDYGTVAPEPLPTDSLSVMSAPAQQFAGIQSTIPPRQDVDAVIDYYDLAEQTADPVAQEVRLPGPLPIEPPVQRALTPPSGDIAIPTASDQYVRPYEALPPGFFPPLEQPGGDLLSFVAPQPAPAPEAVFEPAPQFASFQPSEVSDLLVQEASSATYIDEALQQTSLGGQYTVVAGDTLFGISRNYGISAAKLADANDRDLNAPIYVGDTLSVPQPVEVSGEETLSDAPIVVLQTAEMIKPTVVEKPMAPQPMVRASGTASENVDMVDIEELARYFKESNSQEGFGELPTISAQAAESMRGRAVSDPVEYISDPGRAMAHTPEPAPVLEPVMSAPSPVTASIQTFVPDVSPTYQAAAQPAAVAQSAFAWPVQGEVYRLSEGQIEIDAQSGSTVAASAAGRVVHVEDGPRGVLVVIEHNDGWRSLTLGVERPRVVQGQRVNAGTPIGEVSSHRVRFELRDTQAQIADSLGALRG